MSSRERSPGFITRDSETEYRAGRRIAPRVVVALMNHR